MPAHDNSDLVPVIRDLPPSRILVLGDLMLDRYTLGDAGRVSQEAPIVVLRTQERKAQLGGAANVCQMLRGLETEVVCAGAVGDDAEGIEVRSLLEDRGVDCSLVVVDATRPTTVKERFVGRAAGRHLNQILRVDTESCEPLSDAVASPLVSQVINSLAEVDLLLISDYAKGVCTSRGLREIISAARDADCPVLVDPRSDGGLEAYTGATLLKPNRAETAAATGCKVETNEVALAAGRDLCRRLNLNAAVITLDRDGIALVRRDGPSQVFPTTARSVYDITGAGDMVLATLGACLAGGTDIEAAVRLANITAGIEVQRAGTSVVPRAEVIAELQGGNSEPVGKVVDLATAAAVGKRHQSQGQTVVFTNGCFDLLHVGHLKVLAEAASLGDVLVVGVNSDASVRRLKGPSRPVIGESDRAAMLAALEAVAYVVIFDEDTPHALLHAIRPDVLVKGGTYAPHEVVGHEVVTAYGGRIAVTNVIDGISTTKIVASLQEEPSAFRKAS